MKIKIKIKSFLLGAVLGLLTLITQTTPAEAISFPFPKLFDLPRLLPISRLIPQIRPLPTLPQFRSITNPFPQLTITSTPTIPAVATPTPTPTLTLTPIPTETPTLTPTVTFTPIPTITPSPTPTITPTVTPTTGIEVPTSTVTPTVTPTTGVETPTPTVTLTPTVTTAPSVGLVAYWKMEESDNTILDSSGNGYNLIGQGDLLPEWQNDTPPTSVSDTKSLYFNGNNFAMLADNPNNPAFDFPTGFTLEAWIKASSSQQDSDSAIISKWLNQGYMIWVLSNGKLVNYTDGTGVLGTSDIRDDRWHHVAMTWNGGVTTLYIDGIAEASSIWTQPSNSIDKTFALATYGPPVDFRNFTGNMDEVKIYDYARTPTEILQDAGLLTINEFVPNPAPDASAEWVEFYNPNHIDMSGFWLDDDTSFADDIGTDKKPLSTLNTTDPSFPYFEVGDTMFNNPGDMVVLFAADGSIIDQYQYSTDPGDNKSIGRNPDGSSWMACTSSSKGATNNLLCP